MKWFHLLPVAAVLTLAISAPADEVARRNLAAETQTGLPLETTVSDQTRYADYPAEAYPAGFTSYRGMGFMGSCCEPSVSAAACLWKDYCRTKDHCAKFDGLGYGFKRGCCKPSLVLAVNGRGAGCCSPGPSLWLKIPCSPPIGERLRCLKANVSSLFSSLHASCTAPNCSGCTGRGRATPTPAEDLTPAHREVPTPPAPAAEADSAPIPPRLPSPPTADKTTRTQLPMRNAPLGASFQVPGPSPRDKSASRIEPRVLRALTVSF